MLLRISCLVKTCYAYLVTHRNQTSIKYADCCNIIASSEIDEANNKT